MPRTEPASSEQLDLGHLAFFVGLRVNEAVLEALHESGFDGLRPSHGFIFQHLLGTDRSITELAELLGVTQQGASKVVTDLKRLGYVEEVATSDARVRRVRLSARGTAAVQKTRALRAALEKSVTKKCGAPAMSSARALLSALLESLDGPPDVRVRRPKAPAAAARAPARRKR
jgi:DNA-binding MarR family transcriptional regulator